MTDSKTLSLVREVVVPCIRLVQMMLSIDSNAGLLFLICWVTDLFQDILLVWVDSRTYTMIQQLFTNAGPRDKVPTLLITLWTAKFFLAFASTATRRFQSRIEKRIKKKLRMKMALLLIDSYSSLDYVSQNNPETIRVFDDAQSLLNGSIINRSTDVLNILMHSLKIVLLCISFASQIRGRQELMMLPVVSLVLLVGAFNRYQIWAFNSVRNNRRGGGKTKQHRRRDALRFPFLKTEFRREAVLRTLGPWVAAEYAKASEFLMSRGSKPQRLERERAMDFYRIFHSVTRDCLSIGLIVSAAPIQLATFNLMLSIMTSFGMNLSNLTMYCDIIGCIYLPKIQAYFRCLDMRLPPPPSALSRVLKRQDAGFDLQGVNITFCYPHQSEPAEETKQKDDIPVTAGKPVLENLSFHFEAGKMHALVGDNGSGKSTLVQLITQLYDTHAGTIYLNGYDIKQYRVSEIRSHMSVMFQDIAKLFRFSVLENIGLGDTSLLSTDPAKIEAVAKQHHVTDFISVDTVIGDLYQVHKDPDEKWQAELSGGQWQKIALARTFIKAQDADLIILDEPTSALDAEAEYQFFQQLRTLRKDKTTIFITHKYVTTATADCIHFMKGGRIVERGSHAELMASQGEYAKRYRFQTQGYNEK